MKINEINTERLTRQRLEWNVKKFFDSIHIYGKCNDMLFMIFDGKTGVYDLTKNKFILFNERGIAYPVCDGDNNNYLMVITAGENNRVYNTDDFKPRYNDTSETHPYYDEVMCHDLECFCNVYDCDGHIVQPINRYVANIYQFNCMLDGLDNYKSILYRDSYDDCNYDKNYNFYYNLPRQLNDKYMKVSYFSFSSYWMLKDNSKKSFDLDNFVAVKSERSINIYNKNGKLLLSFNSLDFYCCGDDIFYVDDNKYYQYNIENGIKKELNFLSFNLENNDEVKLTLNEILEKFSYYYFDEIKKNFIFFGDKKWGLEIDLQYGIKDKRWFDSEEHKRMYLKKLLEKILNVSENTEFEKNEGKKRARNK